MYEQTITKDEINNPMSEHLYIRSITGPDINNGTGIRLTIWVQGCKHNCKGCHNPQTHEYTSENCIDITKAWTYIKKELLKKDDLSSNNEQNKYLYDGVTLSGGDPLMQTTSALDELINLVTAIRSIRPDINIWIYTGFTYDILIKNSFYNDILHQLQPDVIVDGRFMDHYKPINPSYCPWRGSTNQHLIDFKASYDVGSIVELKL